MTIDSIVPIILCGGTGSRLWPLSRKSYPKQFLSINPEENKSLLQKTQQRIQEVNEIKSPILVCNEDHRFIVAEQMREINIKPLSIILEPFGRNTAPAIAISAIKSLQFEDDPILLVLSSDHQIENINKFVEVVNSSIKYAKAGKIVTFGIVPNSPNTGYGYIEGEEDYQDLVATNIKSFIEKPNKKKAKELISMKRFTWNSGMFLFKASTILNELNKFHPDIVINCRESLDNKLLDLDFERIKSDSFSKCPDISIDIAVMEKTNLGTVIPLDVGWNDIGSWGSVWEISKKDVEGNVVQGNILSKKNKNCLLRGENRLIVGIGLENLIVIETSDAILVANKESSQDIKNIVEELKMKGIKEGIEHKKIFRPWGNYSSLLEDQRWQVKLIYVKPGEQLSLQMHHHRSEHWVVVSGTAKVEIDNDQMMLSENQSAYIPLGSTHRLSNPGKIPLYLIEVQSGSYIGEDDIERFEDNYGRISK